MPRQCFASLEAHGHWSVWDRCAACQQCNAINRAPAAAARVCQKAAKKNAACRTWPTVRALRQRKDC